MRRAEPARALPRIAPRDARARAGRVALAIAQAAAGALLILHANIWFRAETRTSAQLIHMVTGQRAVGAASSQVLILYHGRELLALFKVTSECSAAYMVGGLLIATSPLVLVRRLQWSRLLVALLLAIAVVAVVNVARLTAVGAALSWLGTAGFVVAHTYLGTAMTFIGTATAGIVFALLVMGRGDLSRLSTREAAR